MQYGYDDKVGILDPDGIHSNPLTGNPYSDAYKSLSKHWSKFKTYGKSNDIIKSIHNNQLTFIVAATGVGKSVIVPKLALHCTAYSGKVGMTLPKRSITSSTAAFAALTLDVTLGKEIGYVHKGSPKDMVNDTNRIVYMTDGSLVMKIVNDPVLAEFDVIIIDEAHERKIQIDMLLLLLKLAMIKRPSLRVIIMSATIDIDRYTKYFSGVRHNVINIVSDTNHPIDVKFLLSKSTDYVTNGFDIIDKITASDKIDTLFFITSGNEAMQLCRNIRSIHPSIYCIEVYADMDINFKIYAENRDKYKELGKYDQKLVMATNMAESSLTINGLRCVIDSGYELYSYYDPKSMSKVLEKRMITKAQALQRRGRVGRIEPGICYHLFTKQQFDDMEDYPTPDILRQDISLDLLKMIDISETKTYKEGVSMMNGLMDPPHIDRLDVAYRLFNTYNIIHDGKLTKIGHDITKFSSLPINRSLFLLYSYQLHCAKEASIILAMMDETNGKISNLFYKDMPLCESSVRNKDYKGAIQKYISDTGDHLTLLNIYQAYAESSDRREWTRTLGIKDTLMKRVGDGKRKYFSKVMQLNAPMIDRVKNKKPARLIMEALKKSHIHLVASNMVPEFPIAKNIGKVNIDSAIHMTPSKKKLGHIRFIYDELSCINGNWEYNTVSIYPGKRIKK